MEKQNLSEEDLKQIELLAGLLKKLNLQEGAIWAVFIILPKQHQLHTLMDWLVEELEKGETLTQEIIMEKVELMREE